MHRPKMADIAAAAGVSIATASRALRGLPGVSDPVRERILAIARQMDFGVNPSAATLASGKTRTVAIVAPYLTRWFFMSVVTAAQEVLQTRGLSTLLYNTGTPEARREFFDGLPVRQRADGLIVVALPLDADDRDRLRALRVPVVFIGSDDVAGYASVGVDDEAVGYIATRRLIDDGHASIAFVGGETTDPMSFLSSPARRRGYLRAHREAGLAVDDHLSVPGGFTVRGGYDAAARLLDRPDRPTAIFAASDEMAMGVLRAARERAIPVPGELSVIGVDDHEAAELLEISTVRQHVAEQGRQGARMLMEALARDDEAAPERLALEPQLVVRSTTGPSPVSTRTRRGEESPVS